MTQSEKNMASNMLATLGASSQPKLLPPKSPQRRDFCISLQSEPDAPMITRDLKALKMNRKSSIKKYQLSGDKSMSKSHETSPRVPHKFLHFWSEIDHEEEDEMKKIEAESEQLESFKGNNQRLPVHPTLSNQIQFHQQSNEAELPIEESSPSIIHYPGDPNLYGSSMMVLQKAEKSKLLEGRDQILFSDHQEKQMEDICPSSPQSVQVPIAPNSEEESSASNQQEIATNQIQTEEESLIKAAQDSLPFRGQTINPPTTPDLNQMTIDKASTKDTKPKIEKEYLQPNIVLPLTSKGSHRSIGEEFSQRNSPKGSPNLKRTIMSSEHQTMKEKNDKFGSPQRPPLPNKTKFLKSSENTFSRTVGSFLAQYEPKQESNIIRPGFFGKRPKSGPRYITAADRKALKSPNTPFRRSSNFMMASQNESKRINKQAPLFSNQTEAQFSRNKSLKSIPHGKDIFSEQIPKNDYQSPDSTLAYFSQNIGNSKMPTAFRAAHPPKYEATANSLNMTDNKFD